MTGPSALQLVTAWVASAVVAPVVYVGWVIVAVAFLGGGWPSPKAMLQWLTIFFGGALIFQLLYGGFVYVVFRRLGLFNLLTVLLAYLVPLAVFLWMGSDRQKDLIEAIPKLTLAFMVALVGWFFARSPN
jgi:hypothetical protein